LRDSRVFPIFEGSNDVLRAFVAVADEVADLRHLNLADPICSIGILADHAGQRPSTDQADTRTRSGWTKPSTSPTRRYR
jgi:hypothetical protein